jgi:rhodanese/phosphatase family protein
MHLIEMNESTDITEVDVPKELYWVLTSPAPLAGMKYPRPSFPWSNLKAAGFSHVISLHPGSYNPAPLTMPFCEHLEDLVSGGPPRNEEREREKIKKAVAATLKALQSGQGVVVHCVGGRGRSGTVIACTLRELGFGAQEAIAFLDRVHKARGKPGWPESSWQSSLVYAWKPDA